MLFNYVITYTRPIRTEPDIVGGRGDRTTTDIQESVLLKVFKYKITVPLCIFTLTKCNA